MSMRKRLENLATAEGYTLADMKLALDEVRKENYTGGVTAFEVPVPTEILDDHIRESVVSIRDYRLKPIGEGVSERLKSHYKSAMERLQLSMTDDEKMILQTRRKAKVGDTITIHDINASSFSLFKQSRTYRLDADSWMWVEYWSELAEKIPVANQFFTGIRQKVADKLGVTLSDAFHVLFSWVACGDSKD